MTSDQAIEKQIQSKGLTAPRVTPDHIENVIASEHYFTGAQGVFGCPNAVGFKKVDGEMVPHYDSPAHEALSLLTFCVLVLKNGYTVTGESACASPENFDAELGREIARKNAVAKIWPLEGYLLKEKLYLEGLGA